MRQAGILLMLAGAIGTFVAFLMPTTVETYSFSPLGGSGVVNLGLLQNQMLVLHVGIGAFIAGAVLTGCGAIIERLPGGSTGSLEDTGAGPDSEIDGIPGRPNHAFMIATILVVVVFVICVGIGLQKATATDPVASNADLQAQNLANEADSLSAEAANLTKSR